MSFIAGYLLGLSEGGTIVEKSITANGTYYAKDDNADGFDPINVKVPSKYNDGFSDGIKYANGEYDNTEVEDDDGGTYIFPDGALPVINDGTPSDDVNNAADLLFKMTGGDGAVTNTSNGWSLMQYTESTDTTLSIKLVLRNARTGETQQIYGRSYATSTSTNNSLVGSIGNVTAGGLTWTTTYNCITSAGKPYEQIQTRNCKVGTNNWSKAWREFIGGGNYYVGGVPSYTPATQ